MLLCEGILLQSIHANQKYFPPPGNPKHNQSVILKEKYDSFLKTFPRENHGIVEYRTFVNNLKEVVTNTQSLWQKVSAEKDTFDFLTDKRHDLNDRKTPHKNFDCQKWK